MNRIIFGSGSQAIYVLDIVRAMGWADPLAFVDLQKNPSKGAELAGIPLVGFEEACSRWAPCEAMVIVAHGNNKLKMATADSLNSAGFSFFQAISPYAMVSPLAKIADGCIVNAGAVILPGAVLSAHVIVHSGAVIEHDCVINEACNIAPGVTLAGRVNVDSGAYLYTGCSIAPGIHIGKGAVIGAGSVVLKSIPDFGRFAGNPAKPI